MSVRGGILAYGTYVPRFRLRMADVSAALRGGPSVGERAVAGFDEDTTTMAVDAARSALRSNPALRPRIAEVWLATTWPTYADKTNATALHAALGLNPNAGAYDLAGSVRSTCAALGASFDADGPDLRLVVGSDLRGGPAGSPDERDGGDGAGALVIGTGDVGANLLAKGATTREFLDRWRSPGEWGSRTWEERFGESVYLPAGDSAIREALRKADIGEPSIDRIAVCGPQTRAVSNVRRSLKGRGHAVSDPLPWGCTGAAEPLMALASLLDQGTPEETLALLVLADGADCFLFRTTEILTQLQARQHPHRARSAVVDYPSYLTWRGELRRQVPRRPEPDIPVAPATGREEHWKFAFQGSRCTRCQSVHLPPNRVCANCGAVDQMEPAPSGEQLGTVSATTSDHLAWSLSPPVVVAIVDFDQGGRVQCEVADVTDGELRVGDRVQMSFRVGYTVSGIANYVWKAKRLDDRENQQ